MAKIHFFNMLQINPSPYRENDDVFERHQAKPSR